MRDEHLIEIFLISLASLLVEIAYTRIISFKLFYYYTYLVIGLALLGIGAGSVFCAVSDRLKRASTDAVLLVGCLTAAASLVVSYLVIARIPIASLTVWEYGESEAVANLASLVVICLALFASFVGVGIMISTLFSRATEGISKLYFADLAGAALACAAVVYLISAIGPPRMIALAALVLVASAGLVAFRIGSKKGQLVAVPAGIVAIGLLIPGVLPDVRLDEDKSDLAQTETSQWSPIFRVDTTDNIDFKILHHDGMLGSIIRKWDGKVESLADPSYNFDRDLRALPYSVMQEREPGNVMIIGAAGGHEVLASLYFKAKQIDAVELNPLTYDLVTGKYAEYSGNVATHPGVNYVNGDGRSFLARQDKKYDLVWYPAPDSYAATNAASAGAFVLSESYLYTSETIQDSLEHLTDDGIIATQFGEIHYDAKPNRTTRYVATVRHALEQAGVSDPGAHVLIATTPSGLTADVSTVLIKKTPFTPEEVAAFSAYESSIEGFALQYTPSAKLDNTVTNVLTLPVAEQRAWLDSYPYEVDAIDDDGPFFWHFARYGTVLSDFGQPIDRFDTEDSLGERVIVLLLVLATILAAVFLLLPFVKMRKTWTDLPRKGTSALYFMCLGFGFMFFEITLIQRLVLFLGYPTYSLTVTLASLLLFTGAGALLSGRLQDRGPGLLKVLAGVVVALGCSYLWLLPILVEAMLETPLLLRVAVAFIVLAPLGLLLGMFMPLGLRAVAVMDIHPQVYVAWGWAVNGFASVIGSVLVTIIAMITGFNVVLVVSMVLYLVAIAALHRLRRPLEPRDGGVSDVPTASDEEEMTLAAAPT